MERFLVRRNFIKDCLILGGCFAELVLLQAASRPLEMFVDVLRHGNSCVLRLPRPARARWDGRMGLRGNLPACHCRGFRYDYGRVCRPELPLYNGRTIAPKTK